MKQLAIEQLGRLRRRALNAESDKLRANCVTAADMIIAGLELCGAIDRSEAHELSRHWVESYSRDRLEGATTAERLAALWRGGDVADFISRAERAEMIEETSKSLVGGIK